MALFFLCVFIGMAIFFRTKVERYTCHHHQQLVPQDINRDVLGVLMKGFTALVLYLHTY